MSWVTLAAIYFTTWWVVLFTVLPMGVRPQEGEREPGTEAGAPAQPMLVKKFLLTSVISAVIVAMLWGVFASGLLDWRSLTRPDGG